MITQVIEIFMSCFVNFIIKIEYFDNDDVEYNDTN